jgi:hypothetical protein
VELRDFQAFGEPGAIVYLADCVDLMKIIPSGSVDVVFADPPYRLSRGGVTVKSGKLAPVDKGAWDRSMGFAEDHRFNVRWLKEACRILKPEGTIWVTGTHHIIFSLGFALQSMRLKIINVIRSRYKLLPHLEWLREGAGDLQGAVGPELNPEPEHLIEAVALIWVEAVQNLRCHNF